MKSSGQIEGDDRVGGGWEGRERKGGEGEIETKGKGGGREGERAEQG